MKTNHTNSRIEPLESRIAPAVIVVTTLGDTPVTGKTTLRQAIADATGATNTIVFKPGLRGYIELTSGTLLINHELTISGPGGNKILINGDAASSIFTITGGTKVTLGGLTLVNGVNTTGSGGAINSDGPLTVSNCVISGNTAEKGGGIYDTGTGPFILVNSAVTGNKAVDSNSGIGGGVYAYASTGGIAIIGTKILDNSSDDVGGGLNLKLGSGSLGNLTISTSEISGNLAFSVGGGARLYGDSATGKVLVTSSVVSGNISGEIGGGVQLTVLGPALFTGTNFLNNQSGENGGGLWVNGPGSLAVHAGRFAANIAEKTYIGGGIYSDITGNSVTIAGATLVDNQASVGGALAIKGSPNLIIAGTNISDNHATGTSGGIEADTTGTTKITGCTIAGNSAQEGAGGAYLTGSATITVQSTKFLGNTTTGVAGGLAFGGPSSQHNLIGDTFANNTALSNGGGLYVTGAGTFSVIDSAFTGNSSGGEGGGIFIDASASGTIHTPGVLITGNAATGGGGGVAHVTGSTGTVTLKVSTVTGNAEGIPKTDTYGNFTP